MLKELFALVSNFTAGGAALPAVVSQLAESIGKIAVAVDQILDALDRSDAIDSKCLPAPTGALLDKQESDAEKNTDTVSTVTSAANPADAINNLTAALQAAQATLAAFQQGAGK